MTSSTHRLPLAQAALLKAHGPAITHEQLATGMPLTDAAVREAARLVPPVHGFFRHVKKDITVRTTWAVGVDGPRCNGFSWQGSWYSAAGYRTPGPPVITDGLRILSHHEHEEARGLGPHRCRCGTYFTRLCEVYATPSLSMQPAAGGLPCACRLPGPAVRRLPAWHRGGRCSFSINRTEHFVSPGQARPSDLTHDPTCS